MTRVNFMILLAWAPGGMTQGLEYPASTEAFDSRLDHIHAQRTIVADDDSPTGPCLGRTAGVDDGLDYALPTPAIRSSATPRARA